MVKGFSTRSDRRNLCRILVGKPQGKRLLGRRRRRCGNNINMDIREIDWRDVGYINLVREWDHWRAIVHKIMTIRVA
jgi:hypothetical protein